MSFCLKLVKVLGLRNGFCCHCCWVVAFLTSKQLVHLRDRSAQTVEIEVADQIFHLTQSQYTDTGPTSPSADPTTPGASGNLETDVLTTVPPR